MRFVPLALALACALSSTAHAAGLVARRADSLAVSVTNRAGIRLGSVRVPRTSSVTFQTWRNLPLYAAVPSATTIGLTGATWTSEDFADVPQVEVRLDVDSVANGTRVLVKAGALVRQIVLRMPAPRPPEPVVRAPAPAAAPRTSTDAQPESDSLPAWVRVAKETFARPSRLRAPTPPIHGTTSAVTAQPAADATAVEPATTAPVSVRPLTAGRPTAPEFTAALKHATGGYDVADLLGVGGVPRPRPSPPPSTDQHTIAFPSSAPEATKTRARQEERAPVAMMRFAYLSDPQFAVVAVERPLTAGFSLGLESGRSLRRDTTAPTVPAANVLGVAARWYLLTGSRTPYVFADVGLAWQDSTRTARQGAGFGLIWPIGSAVDIDAAIRAWGTQGKITDATRVSLGLRLHFAQE